MRVIGSVGEPFRSRNGWSQALGDFVEFEWRGTEDYAASVFSQVRGFCAECYVDYEGGKGVVVARYASTNQPGGEELLRTDVRLGRNDVQKSIFEPGMDGFTSGITSEEIRNIRALIDDPLDDVAFTFMVEEASDDAQELYDLAEKGMQYRTVHQPTIIQVTTASSLFTWPNAGANAGSIFSQSTMLGSLRMTPLFSIPQPADVAPSGFNYGWKLMPPTYEQTSDGHSSEVLEFEFGLWPEFVFGAPI